jgi:CheY-like chemotaxis protein
MRALLEGWGCQVQLARSKDDALHVLETSQQKPHVILADYHLDQGTGLDAVAAIRSASGMSIPVAIISADHSAELQRDIRRRGFMHLRKPVKAAALRSVLMQLALMRSAAE